MPYNDIQRLRQQYVFSPTADISGGDIDFGPPPVDYGDGYDAGYGEPIPPQAPVPQQAAPGQAGMGAPPPITPPKAPSYDPNTSIQATIDAINKVYTPENVDRDRLRKLMDSYPERQAPSFGRSLVAAGLSLKAADPIATSEKVMNAPHLRDVADWSARADPFYKTAQLENASNINERTLAGNVVTGVTAAERLAEQARQADAKQEASMIRARAYAAKNSGWEVRVVGDRLVAVNPITKQHQDIGESGKLDEQTRLDVIGQWGVDAAAARGEAGVKIAQAGGVARGDGTVIGADGKAYRLSPDGTTYVQVPGLPKGTPNKIGTPGSVKPDNTLETRRQEQDRMSDAYERDPIARKWIRKTTNGIYEMKPRPVVGPATGWGPFGSSEVTQADANEWDAVKKESDPSYVPPAPVETKGIGTTGTAPDRDTKTNKVGIGPSEPPPPVAGRGTGYRGATPTVTPEQRQRAVGYLLEHGVDKPTEQQIGQTIADGYSQPDAQMNYKVYQANKSNPKEIRRSVDGRNFEYSHDGGQTWGPR